MTGRCGKMRLFSIIPSYRFMTAVEHVQRDVFRVSGEEHVNVTFMKCAIVFSLHISTLLYT